MLKKTMKLAIDQDRQVHLFVKTVTSNDSFRDARPITFILPGCPGADHAVYESYECLASESDLVFHDPRGCGLSVEPNLALCNMENYIDDVAAIRKSITDQSIIVLGKSYGSMCALGFALRYPNMVDKLILAAGAPSYRFLDRAQQFLLQHGSAEQIAIAEKLWRGTFENEQQLKQYFELTQPLYSYRDRMDHDIKNEAQLEKKAGHFAYQVLNEGFRNAFWHFDYEALLAQIKCPTLILAGKEDWINAPDYAELMAKKIPNSELHIFANASHAFEKDVPDEYFSVIKKFISG